MADRWGGHDGRGGGGVLCEAAAGVAGEVIVGQEKAPSFLTGLIAGSQYIRGLPRRSLRRATNSLR